MKLLKTLLIAVIFLGLLVGCSSIRDMNEQANAGDISAPSWGDWEPWTGPGWAARQ